MQYALTQSDSGFLLERRHEIRTGKEQVAYAPVHRGAALSN